MPFGPELDPGKTPSWAPGLSPWGEGALGQGGADGKGEGIAKSVQPLWWGLWPPSSAWAGLDPGPHPPGLHPGPHSQPTFSHLPPAWPWHLVSPCHPCTGPAHCHLVTVSRVNKAGSIQVHEDPPS